MRLSDAAADGGAAARSSLQLALDIPSVYWFRLTN